MIMAIYEIMLNNSWLLTIGIGINELCNVGNGKLLNSVASCDAWQMQFDTFVSY